MELWKKVKDLEEYECGHCSEMGSARATMMVNFGPDGRCRPDIIDTNLDLSQMVVKVFTFYEESLKEKEDAHA